MFRSARVDNLSARVVYGGKVRTMDKGPMEDKKDQGPQGEEGTPVDERNWKEKLYDKIPVSMATLDKIIIGLFILLGLALVIGIIRGHGG